MNETKADPLAQARDTQPVNSFKPRNYSKVERHKVNACNEVLDILVLDEPGSGGAHHSYLISWPGQFNPWKCEGVHILFQNGPIKENGVNGLTQEALLAVVAHRLECFQAGPYACESNASALVHVLRALEILKDRTRERQARGVEGTHEK